MPSREQFETMTRWMGIAAVALMALAAVIWSGHSLMRMIE